MARVDSGEHDRFLVAFSKAGQRGGGLQRFSSEPTPTPKSHGVGWEDADEELGEEEVWGEVEAAQERQSQGAEEGGGTAAKRRSLLSMELKAMKAMGRVGGRAAEWKEGIGFAAAAAAAENGQRGRVVTRRVSIGGGGGWRAEAAEVEEEEEEGGVPKSAPVLVPAWIRRSRSCGMMAAAAEAEEEEEEEEAAEEGWVPPHEMVARGQGMTSSVCEGAGRTLKGMDLRRVRNAVWSRTGFAD